MLHRAFNRFVRVLATIGFLFLVAAGCLLLMALFPKLLKGPIALLTRQDPPVKADLIVVLSGGPVTRPLEARDFYKRGLSKKILLIPEPPNHLRQELRNLGFEEQRYSTSQRILMASGIPLSAIEELPTHANGTNEETRLVGAYIGMKASGSILLVTSPLSSRRQCWLFDRALPSVRISCQPTSYDEIPYERRLVLWVINEFLKLAANIVGIH